MAVTAGSEQGNAERAEALTGRLFNAAQESLDILTVYMGDRLGLYRALADRGPVAPSELAAAASTKERYTREWLEQQAVSGILEVDDPAAPATERRYTLAPGHAESLVDPESSFSIAPLARGIVACAQALPAVLEAFAHGGGVAWSAYGGDAIEAQGDFNRPWLLARFATEHLPQIADVHDRLRADPPARVGDFACGLGWAAIAIARNYPKVTVHGFDLDEGSIEGARRNAADSGLADRVTFSVGDITDPAFSGEYDLVVAIEGIHDLPRPVEALATIRRVLAPGGAAIALEEKVADSFTPGHPIDRFMYAFSVLLCLPAAMAEQPSAATGTVMRPETFRRYALEAGFRDLQILDIDLPMQRYYRLMP